MKTSLKIGFFSIILIWSVRHCSPGIHTDIKMEKIQKVTKLNIIYKDIDRFENKPIVIRGRVSSTFYLSLIGSGYYLLTDKSGGSIIVTTYRDLTPNTGKDIEVIVVPKVFLKTNTQLWVTTAEIKRLPKRHL